jgi:hypothetical protein
MEILIGLVIVLAIFFYVTKDARDGSSLRCPACGAYSCSQRIEKKYDNEMMTSLMSEYKNNLSTEDQRQNRQYHCSRCGEIYMLRFAEQGEKDLKERGEKFALDHYAELKKLM